MKLFLLVLIILSVFAIDNTEAAARKLCGANLYKKLFALCPIGCTVEDENLPTKLCSFGFDDTVIKAMCCPE